MVRETPIGGSGIERGLKSMVCKAHIIPPSESRNIKMSSFHDKYIQVSMAFDGSIKTMNFKMILSRLPFLLLINVVIR